jgi:hypothetical protein
MKNTNVSYLLLMTVMLMCTSLCAQSQVAYDIIVVEVKILPVVKLVVIDEGDKWVLNPSIVGTESKQGMLLIRANVPWVLGVKDYDPLTVGHMTEWNGLEYGTLRLKEPVHVKAESEVVLPEGGLIQHGEKTGGQDIPFHFTQKISWEDKPISENRTYRIVATFYTIARF